MKIIFFCFLVFFINQSTLFAAENEGYFLSLDQKGQLISLGLIQDHDGVWYNIWVCPGYVPPYRYAKKYFYKAGTDFGEYFHVKKYGDLVDDSKKSYRWAFDDCIHDFIINGVPKAWEKHFETASTRTEKRVFGWWFAYPWAFMESTVESIVRVPFGLTGSVLGVGWATAVVPTYHMTNSSVKGLWHLTVNTVTIPIIGATWNTVISPPLSLVGQKPSLDRVDGFWVKALTEEQVLNMKYSDSPISSISQEDIVLLKQWGSILETELKPYENKYSQIRKETEIATKKITDFQKEKELIIREEQSQRMDNLRVDPDKQQLLNSLSERGYTANRLKALRDNLRETLKENGTEDEKQIYRLMDLLIKYPPSLANEKGFRSNKTDPLRRSLDVVKDID